MRKRSCFWDKGLGLHSFNTVEMFYKKMFGETDWMKRAKLREEFSGALDNVGGNKLGLSNLWQKTLGGYKKRPKEGFWRLKMMSHHNFLSLGVRRKAR